MTKGLNFYVPRTIIAQAEEALVVFGGFPASIFFL